MSVQKSSPQRLRVERTPHTIVANKIVQSITNPDALAIWTYLQSKSTNWKVVASYIQKHFGIGRDRYRKAMSLLVEMGLVSYVVDQDEKTGQLLGREIVVHCEPRVQESVPSGSPTVQETDRSDNPSLGESTPYETERELHERNPEEGDERTPSPDGEPSVEDDPPEEPVDPDIEVPDVIDPEAWRSFVEHRRQIKSPMTEKAKTMLANKLVKFADAGHDPNAILEESIMNGWRGVFEPKSSGRKLPPRTGFNDMDYRAGLRQDENGRYRA